MKLKIALHRYLEDRKTGWRKLTYERAASMFRTFAYAYWNDANLLDKHVAVCAKPTHVASLYVHFSSASPKSASTLKLASQILCSFFRWLRRNDILTDDQFRKACWVRVMDHAEVGRMPCHAEPYTEQEYRLMMDHATKYHPEWADVIRVAWETGLRMIDIMELNAHNLDLDRRALKVVPIKTGKIKPKPLIIPLRESTLERLVELAGLVPLGDPILAGVKDVGMDFPLPLKFRVCILEPLGLHRRGRGIHSLRRSFITTLHNKGVDIPTICSLTGQAMETVLTYITVDMKSKLDALGIDYEPPDTGVSPTVPRPRGRFVPKKPKPLSSLPPLDDVFGP